MRVLHNGGYLILGVWLFKIFMVGGRLFLSGLYSHAFLPRFALYNLQANHCFFISKNKLSEIISKRQDPCPTLSFYPPCCSFHRLNCQYLHIDLKRSTFESVFCQVPQALNRIFLFVSQAIGERAPEVGTPCRLHLQDHELTS